MFHARDSRSRGPGSVRVSNRCTTTRVPSGEMRGNSATLDPPYRAESRDRPSVAAVPHQAVLVGRRVLQTSVPVRRPISGRPGARRRVREVSHRLRPAGKLEAVRVKRLSDRDAVDHVEQPSRLRVDRRPHFRQLLRTSVVGRAHHHGRRAVAAGGIKKVAAVWQERRIAMTHVPGDSVEHGHWRALAAGCRDARKRLTIVRAEDDHACRAPGAVVRARGIGEHLRAGGTQIETLQFALRAERDGAAVGRPERLDGVLGVRERRYRERIEPADPERSAAVRRPAGEEQLLSIG